MDIKDACEALGVPRASYYRSFKPTPKYPENEPGGHPRGLTEAEEIALLSILNSEEFCDLSVHEIFPALLDRGIYICSKSAMYRVLRKNNEVKERREQASHPNYKKPELLATCPNQVWSWDITKLFGPQKWTYYYLYVILDIFSRYAVGWMIAHRESAELAKHLIEDSFKNQGIKPGELTIHSDRGPAMTSITLSQLLMDLGVLKSHSRPYVSNDNPFSESQFKTIKYRPDFPDRFGCVEDARTYFNPFFKWYNWEHYHSGIGYLPPGIVHYGLAETIISKRQKVLDTAYETHPERFGRGRPQASEVPKAVWINPPKRPEFYLPETLVLEI